MGSVKFYFFFAGIIVGIAVLNATMHTVMGAVMCIAEFAVAGLLIATGLEKP